MKTKTCSLSWAMALCAVAVLSFSAAGVAQAGEDSIMPPQPIDTSANPQPMPRVWWIEPKPAADVSDGDAAVGIGTFYGTVMD